MTEPTQTRSATAMVLEELQLYGYRPFAGEPDPRPLPDPHSLQTALTDIFDALVVVLTETRLEPDLEDLLWSTTNVFHRMAIRVERELDSNEQAQKRSQRDQDGSEVRSVELETLTAEGISLVERRSAYELMRDLAAEVFETHLGQAWHPRAGSQVSHRTLTAAMIDSRDHLAAKRRAELEPLLPAGAKIAFTGGLDCNDHRAIWEALDRVRIKHPDMVLLHGGSPRGAEKIASCWADNRGCTQIVFKPDWTRHGKAAPFRRNDELLAVLPIGLIVFPGSASPTTWPTRPARWVSRSSTSARGRAPSHDRETADTSCGRSPSGRRYAIIALRCRRWWRRDPSTRRPPMIVSTALCVLGLGAMCWMLFTLAVYALPVWLAIMSGLYLHSAGFGTVAALGGGMLVGAALVIAGQIAFATIRSVPLRLAIGFVYTAPAAFAGFHATAGLARLTSANEGPALVLAVLGAAIIGGTAWIRVAALAGDDVSGPA